MPRIASGIAVTSVGLSFIIAATMMAVLLRYYLFIGNYAAHLEFSSKQIKRQ